MQKVDVLIVGGGLSGLSLAYFLADVAPHMRVKVLEARTNYRHHRYWGCWVDRQQPHPFADLAERRYRRWHVTSQAGLIHTCFGGRYSYAVIPSDRWYAAVLARIGDRVERGVSCAHVTATQVETASEQYLASMVIDARPEGEAKMYQQCESFWVRAIQPVFDDSQAKLMDFSLSAPPNACAFLYMLPFSRSQALVEPVLYTQTSQHHEQWFAGVMPMLEARYGPLERSGFDQKGCLPLRARPLAWRPGQAYPIGARAGWMRPSSGYAFTHTMAQAERLARYIARYDTLPKRPLVPYSQFATWLDAIFLRAMRMAPDAFPDIFYHWFKGLPADVMVDFLHDQRHWSIINQLMSRTARKWLLTKHTFKELGARCWSPLR